MFFSFFSVGSLCFVPLLFQWMFSSEKKMFFSVLAVLLIVLLVLFCFSRFELFCTKMEVKFSLCPLTQWALIGGTGSLRQSFFPRHGLISKLPVICSTLI